MLRGEKAHLRRRRVLFIAAAVAFAVGYVYLLYWFRSVDFYHRHFFDEGALAQDYQRARLVFVFYFAWLIYSAGIGALAVIVGRERYAVLRAWERYPLGFLIGAAVWSVPLYAAGLASMYQKPLAVGATLVIMAASLPHLAACIEEASTALLRLCNRLRRFVSDAAKSGFCSCQKSETIDRSLGLLRMLLSATLVTATGAAAILFILTKGLYPGGGHDYYNHYFPYYVRVVQSGSTLPNDVWYHFFYSKGDGLYFIAMLLTDPLAPQLVTTSFIACAAAIVFALLRRATSNRVLPLVGVFLYIALFIYTPGQRDLLASGGWGYLEKEHELTAVTILGVVWCSFEIFGKRSHDRAPWMLGLLSAIIFTAAVTIELAFLLGVFFTGFLLWFASGGRWVFVARAIAACATAVICIFIVFAINYHYTGIILDALLLPTWPFTDLAKVAQWGVTFEVLQVHLLLIRFAANALSWWSPDTLWVLLSYLRLDLWWPVLISAVPLIALRFVSGKCDVMIWRSVEPLAFGILGWFFATVILVALIGGGRTQYVSFYRLSSFSYAPTLCLSLLVWGLAIPSRTSPVSSSAGRSDTNRGCTCRCYRYRRAALVRCRANRTQSPRHPGGCSETLAWRI